jgi:HSP20 family protein
MKTQEESQKAVTAWEPFSDLREWRPFGRDFPARWGRWLRELDEDWPRASGRRSWLPALDVHENDGQYAVTVELPGMDKEDVTIEFDEGMLTIRGEKRSEREENGEKPRFVERRYGAFSRSFSLPRDADPDRIEARFDKGVLTLTIAKNEAAKPRTVAIK